MNGGIINEELLAKNIEYLLMYIEEEKKALSRICNNMNSCNESFKENLNFAMSNNIDKMQNSYNMVYLKRLKYVENLKKAIVRYRELAENTNQIFSNGENKYE